MDYEQERNRLEEDFQKLVEQKEGLERQIAFHTNFIIPKLRSGAELESEESLVASLESDYSEILKNEEASERKLRSLQSKEFEFGWTKKGMDEVLERNGGRLGTHSSEREALEIIAEKCGETSIGLISGRMHVGYDYARLLCMSLARADYIDITSRGRCMITPKGENEVHRIGQMVVDRQT